ncbi:MAG: amidohydrolase family protein [Clostridiales bacterium]|nr:amidohydrolase family protein [Clostridiales bacterium]
MKRIFINGKIRAIDAENRLYQAMGCEDGKIAALGTKDEVIKAMGDCEIVDLAGRDVLPGFIDAHIHLLDHAIFEKKTALLSGVKSVEELVQTMKAYIADENIPEGQWVTGFGWDQEAFPDGQFPTCEQLDQITDKHPLMLNRRCGTICAANSMAMRIAGVDRNTKDPQGGELVRFADGSPTGVMLESAMSLIGDCVPKIGDKLELKELLAFSFDEMVKNGVTVCHTEDFYSYVGSNLTGSTKTILFGLLSMFALFIAVYVFKQIYQGRQAKTNK